MTSSLQNTGDLALSQATRPQNTALQKGAGTTDIDKAAKDFESMFMAQMLQPMFETVGVDPIFGGGHGEEAMRGFLIQEYGKVAAKGAGLGIASAVRDELLRAQQTTNAKTTMAKAPSAMSKSYNQHLNSNKMTANSGASYGSGTVQ